MTTPTALVLARQLRAHEYLLGRGWQLDGDRDPAAAWFADDPRAGWRYPASFGGRHLNAVADVTPAGLSSHFTFDDDGAEVLVVVAAGNPRGNGCAGHDSTEYVVRSADGAIDLDELTALLDTLEPRAASLDPRTLIECLFFGPCKG